LTEKKISLYTYICDLYKTTNLYKHKFVQHFSDKKKLFLKETPYLTFHILKIY